MALGRGACFGVWGAHGDEQFGGGAFHTLPGALYAAVGVAVCRSGGQGVGCEGAIVAGGAACAGSGVGSSFGSAIKRSADFFKK